MFHRELRANIPSLTRHAVHALPQNLGAAQLQVEANGLFCMGTLPGRPLAALINRPLQARKFPSPAAAARASQPSGGGPILQRPARPAPSLLPEPNITTPSNTKACIWLGIRPEH